jgi:hypothetical protein
MEIECKNMPFWGWGIDNLLSFLFCYTGCCDQQMSFAAASQRHADGVIRENKNNSGGKV